jgi:hypothetical protein
MMHKFKRRLMTVLAGLIIFGAVGTVYVKSHPLVFNESFFEHAHCIFIGGTSLEDYAQDHGGRFPSSTNGYGDALLSVTDAWFPSLTGPGYDAGVFECALKTGQHVPENACGRVYVQGLSDTNDPEIAILFDKLPTPGGDHCHLLARMMAPLAREVWTIGDGHHTVRMSEWPAFAQSQIDLLVAAGIPREQALRYYADANR